MALRDAELPRAMTPDAAPPPSNNTPAESQPRRSRKREWLLLLGAVVLLVAIVLPPQLNLGRYQRRIAQSISGSLGRPVTMGKVSLRLLPVPALVLNDLVVLEGPGFGAEPVLRSPNVLAELRLASLWRGRLEVSHITLSDASVNLVRNQDGLWNIGSILLQASQLATAPTAQRRAGAAPRFPYIEASNARINVKQGVEKLPYSLESADFSMWLAEPDQWQVKLEAQPVRTDLELGLSDTGLLHIEGKLHRASALGQVPVALHVQWSSAPLGQMSRMLLGSDQGWRGDVRTTADLTGPIDDLAIAARVQVANLHRLEFTPAEAFNIDATCHARYSRRAQRMDNIACRWPLSSGRLLLAGRLLLTDQLQTGTETGSGASAAQPGTAVGLTLDKVPASFMLSALGMWRKEISIPAGVAGTFAGHFDYAPPVGAGVGAPLPAGTPAGLTGSATAEELTIPVTGLDTPLTLHSVVLSAGTSGLAFPLSLTAAPIDLGAATPLAVSSQLSDTGFSLRLDGSGALARLLPIAGHSHLFEGALAHLAPQAVPGSTADLDITLRGPWLGAAPAGNVQSVTATVANGTLHLHNAQYSPAFLSAPVLLPSAQATVLPDQIVWSVPAAHYGHLALQVTATYPLHCTAEQPCPAHVQLGVATLDAGELESRLLGAGEHEELLQAILSRLDRHTTAWPAVEGIVHADTLTLGTLSVHDATASILITGNTARLRSLDGHALGGLLHADGTITMSSGAPHYALTTVLTGANAAALDASPAGEGSLNASAKLTLGGYTAKQLAESAKGSFHAEWTRGSLPGETALAHFRRWTADGSMAGEQLTLTQSELEHTDASAIPSPVKGTIGFDRSLALQVGDTPVTGTLSKPE